MPVPAYEGSTRSVTGPAAEAETPDSENDERQDRRGRQDARNRQSAPAPAGSIARVHGGLATIHGLVDV
jgi:hypothetical protein